MKLFKNNNYYFNNIIIFTSRNLNRINDEVNKYNYKPFKKLLQTRGYKF